MMSPSPLRYHRVRMPFALRPLTRIVRRLGCRDYCFLYPPCPRAHPLVEAERRSRLPISRKFLYLLVCFL